MKLPLLTSSVASEADVVSARQTARFVAQQLGFDQQDQTRLAAAVSEIVRNALQHAGGARVELVLDDSDGQALQLRISDHGPGIADVEAVLHPASAMEAVAGRGLASVSRLMDSFRIDSAPGRGTLVEISKRAPSSAPRWDTAAIAALTQKLTERDVDSPLDALRQQNNDLLRALEALHLKQNEMRQLNNELAETNAGVMALYAELDEKAESLRRSTEAKGRFFSYMNHEVRTPINSILRLSEILQNGSIVPPLPEQKKAIGFIRKAAEQLSELVNDLLDVAKVESGKMQVRTERFTVTELFAALRGMFRPLHLNNDVALEFADTSILPPLHTDEGKVSQILRNLVSNALKFTERGSVNIAAATHGDNVVFTVTDTGIGIAAADQATLFQDFAQIESPRQRGIRGTGLGLALSRPLAELLGGSLSLESRLGHGSVFSLTIPRVLSAAGEVPRELAAPVFLASVLLVVRDLDTLSDYQSLLDGAHFKLFPATSLEVAGDMLVTIAPQVVIVDTDITPPNGWALVQQLCQSAAPQMQIPNIQTPVMMVGPPEHEAVARGLGVAVYRTGLPARNDLIAVLQALTGHAPPPRLLIIDDDEAARYVLRHAIGHTPCDILEAQDGDTGLRRARDEAPDVIFLDLNMAETTGFDVLERLKADAATRHIPVVIHTARPLSAVEGAQLATETLAVLPKGLSHHENAAQVQAALHKVGLPARGG